ncbi:MAG TPA: hypothetical protein VG407_17010 [Caulobacteraceae bacterium]|nr:hypothetical protein [Caulobacteraceae bacterium]
MTTIVWGLAPLLAVAVMYFGGLLTISLLKPQTKSWIERWILAPLLVVVCLGGLTMFAVERKWLLLAWNGFLAAVCLSKIYRMYKPARSPETRQ